MDYYYALSGATRVKSDYTLSSCFLSCSALIPAGHFSFHLTGGGGCLCSSGLATKANLKAAKSMWNNGNLYNFKKARDA